MRRFVFVGEDSSRKSNEASKFWEIGRKGSTLTVRFGPIGANGQTTLKEFATTGEAQKAEKKSIAEKLRKGYVEETASHKKPVTPRPSAKTSSKPFQNKAEGPAAAAVSMPKTSTPGPSGGDSAAFCSHCVEKFASDSAKFCASCGEKRAVGSTAQVARASAKGKGPTPFDTRCEVLMELWLNYRGEDYGEEFVPLFEYFDLAFPLAWAHQEGFAKIEPKGVAAIDECWSELLALFLHEEDSGFEDLKELTNGEYA